MSNSTAIVNSESSSVSSGRPSCCINNDQRCPCPVSCKQSWFAAMECRSAWWNAGSFAVISGLRGALVAI